MKPLSEQTWGTMEVSVFLWAAGMAKAISSLMVILSRLQLDDLGSEESKACRSEIKNQNQELKNTPKHLLACHMCSVRTSCYLWWQKGITSELANSDLWQIPVKLHMLLRRCWDLSHPLTVYSAKTFCRALRVLLLFCPTRRSRYWFCQLSSRDGWSHGFSFILS